MSFDRRLRESLQEATAAIEPEVERNLRAVEARSGRRSGVGVSTLLVAAAIVVAALILRFPDRLGTAPGSTPNATVAPTLAPSPGVSLSVPASYPQIAGTYRVVLDPADPTVQKDDVGGAWTMRLEADGAVLLSPPPTFLPGANGLSGIAFSLAADRFRTDLFYNDYCNSVGTYVWNLVAGRLSFTSVDDTCSIRKTLLTTTPWIVGT